MQVALTELLEDSLHIDSLDKMMEKWDNLDFQDVEKMLNSYYSSHNLFEDIVLFYLCIPKLGALSYDFFLARYKEEFEDGTNLNNRMNIIPLKLTEFLNIFDSVPEEIIREIIFPLLHFNRSILEEISSNLNFNFNPQTISEILNHHLEHKSTDMIVIENLLYLLHQINYSIEHEVINSFAIFIINNNLFNDTLFELKFSLEFIDEVFSINPEVMINQSFLFLSKSRNPYRKIEIYNKIDNYYSHIMNCPLPAPFKTKLLIDQFSNHDVYPIESMDAFEQLIFNSIIFNHERELKRIFSHLPLSIAIVCVGKKIKEIAKNNKLFFCNNFFDEINAWVSKIDENYYQNIHGNNFSTILEFLLILNVEEINMTIFKKINESTDNDFSLMVEYIRSLSKIKNENNFAILSSLFLNYNEIGADYDIIQSIRCALNECGS